jgi:hypothetical protein
LISQLLVTLLLSLLIASALFFLFRWVKTPYYRVDRQRMIDILEMVLTGQATENDWRLTFGMSIRHQPVLEPLRQQCLDIEEKYFIGESKPPYLFSKEGLTELEKVLALLKAEQE